MKMRKKAIFLITLFLLCTSECFAKITPNEKAETNSVTIPTCSNAGELDCPKGFKPSCPAQYKPTCIFLLNKQKPACLADSPDNTFFNYRLDKISCKKK